MIVDRIHIGEIIGGRFDNAYVLYHHRALCSKYPVFPLKHFLVGKPQYGAGEIGVPRTNVNSPRYIRITDIDENGSLIDNIGVTANSIDNKYILNNNDILIARSGNTVGKSYIHKTRFVKEPCIYAGYLIRFVIDDSQILPDYVYIFTKLSAFRDWVGVTQRVTGQPNINAEEYSNLLLPVPPINIQQEIVDLYYEAKQARLEKSQQSKQCLDSIDMFLLNALNIGIDSYCNSSSSRFKQRISSLIGNRLDVSFYKGIEMVLTTNNTIPNKPLGEIARFSDEMWNQKTIFEDYFPYIEINAIDTTYGEINSTEIVSVNKAPSRAKRIVRKNDILISTTRPGRGAICIYNGDGISIASTGFSILRDLQSTVLRDYLFMFLRSSISRKQMELRSSGGNYPAIIESELKRILIPIPSLYVQQMIVDKVHKIKEQAKQLQKEGDALLEEAKQEIEEMIIG